jgi:hypothetical protein
MYLTKFPSPQVSADCFSRTKNALAADVTDLLPHLLETPKIGDVHIHLQT